MYVTTGHGRCLCVCTLCSPGIRSVYDYDVYCGFITVGLVRDFAPEVRARKFVSPEVCVAGSCAGPSEGPSYVIRVVVFAFVAASVQFDPGGPEFVTILASRTPGPGQPLLDVIQLWRDPGGRLFSRELACCSSAVSALLRWDFLSNIRAMARCGLGAHKGPLYGYACVRCGYTNGHHTEIDGLLIDVACCLWCLVVLLCCAGLSDRVFRCSGCHTYARVCPGDVPDNDCYCPASMNMASLHLFALANGRFNTDIEHWFV